MHRLTQTCTHACADATFVGYVKFMGVAKEVEYFVKVLRATPTRCGDCQDRQLQQGQECERCRQSAIQCSFAVSAASRELGVVHHWVNEVKEGGVAKAGMTDKQLEDEVGDCWSVQRWVCASDAVDF